MRHGVQLPVPRKCKSPRRSPDGGARRYVKRAIVIARRPYPKTVSHARPKGEQAGNNELRAGNGERAQIGHRVFGTGRKPPFFSNSSPCGWICKSKAPEPRPDDARQRPMGMSGRRTECVAATQRPLGVRASSANGPNRAENHPGIGRHGLSQPKKNIPPCAKRGLFRRGTLQMRNARGGGFPCAKTLFFLGGRFVMKEFFSGKKGEIFQKQK